MIQEDSSYSLFKVIAKKQSYKNILYLLLSFPLGIIYFIFIVTGISLGIGMVITIFGIFILAGVFYAEYWILVFEQTLVKIFFGKNLVKITLKESDPGIWAKVKALLSDPLLWKGALFLIIKYILGIISFILTVTLISTSLALIATPILISIISNTYVVPFINNNPVLIPVAMAIGIFLLFISLHICNGLAWLNFKLAEGFIKRN